MKTKKTEKYCFSNGSEFADWDERNCSICVKASNYSQKIKDYTKFKCKIQEEIAMQYLGGTPVSERAYQAAQMPICPYIITERKKAKKRCQKVAINQIALF